jgi:hypothetical protein
MRAAIFSPTTGQRDAHAAHPDGAEYMIIYSFDNGHLLTTHGHDAAPAVFDGKVTAGQDGFT